jgi:FkbM family methyltransferase
LKVSRKPARLAECLSKARKKKELAASTGRTAEAFAGVAAEDRQTLLRILSQPKKLNVLGTNLYFHVHSVTEDARVRKFKEPWTIEWMRSLPDNAVLYDIGANIGVTALLATEAKDRNICVVAIEPFPANYASLVKNIATNGMHGRVFPLPIGLGRATTASVLRWANTEVGSSMHSFGNFVSLEDRMPIETAGYHSCICYRLDDLVLLPGLPHPTHLKIDVDGAELDVLGGASAVLRDERCRGIQLELTDQGGRERNDAVEIVQGAGFSLAAIHAHRDPRVCDMQFVRR